MLRILSKNYKICMYVFLMWESAQPIGIEICTQWLGETKNLIDGYFCCTLVSGRLEDHFPPQICRTPTTSPSILCVISPVYCLRSSLTVPLTSSCHPLGTWFRLLQPLGHHFGHSFSLPWSSFNDSKKGKKKIVCPCQSHENNSVSLGLSPKPPWVTRCQWFRRNRSWLVVAGNFN